MRWSAKERHNVLAVFAHPDDEVMVCGTLAAVKKHGGEAHCLYLTHGEDGPTGGLVEKAALGKRRETELADVQGILGLDTLEILDYPDRCLNTIDAGTLKAEIRARVERYKPDTVICFDSDIGLYGHTDHAHSGKCASELLRENPGGVEALLVMTLSPFMIWLAKKVSKTFRERFASGSVLPAYNIAVRISKYARQKNAVVRAHKTQWQVMRDVQPLHHKIHYNVYYRLFAREYFAAEALKGRRG